MTILKSTELYNLKGWFYGIWLYLNKAFFFFKSMHWKKKIAQISGDATEPIQQSHF